MTRYNLLVVLSLLTVVSLQAQVRITDSGSDRDSTNSDISADGQSVVFVSNADLLSEGIPAADKHLWLYDVASRSLTRLTSLSLHTSALGNPVISGDGTKIAFVSSADVNGPATGTGQYEIWYYDRNTSTFTRLTDSTDNGGSSRGCYLPDIDDSGSHVVFSSDADFLNQGQVDQDFEIWMATLPGPTLACLTDRTVNEDDTARGNNNPRISGNGASVTFASDVQLSDPTIADNQFEIYRYSVSSGALLRLTDSTSPDQTARGSTLPDIDRDGQRVVFQSDATLMGSTTGDNEVDTWLWVSGSGLQRLTDVDTDADAGQPRISADGRSVVFSSESDFDGTTVISDEIWLWREGASALKRLTVTTDASRLNGSPAIGNDGWKVVFQSDAQLAGETVADNQFEVWLPWLLGDGFETGNTVAWSAAVP